MYWSVLMLTSTFTLTTKNIKNSTEISAFTIADFILVFIIETCDQLQSQCIS